MGINQCMGTKHKAGRAPHPAGPHPPSPSLPAAGHHPPPGRCKLRARSKFMQRSGSCSVVSRGSPSSTMLSRNWAKGVPRCSGGGAHTV